MKKQLLIIVNEDSFFLSHRTRIAEKAKEKGWGVIIVAKDTGKASDIRNRGLDFIPLPINPTGLNLWQELKLLRFLIQLFKKNQDSIVHLVGLKNILWGGLASKLKGVKGKVFAVSGLGTLFGENQSSLLSSCVKKMLKFSMKGRNNAVIFQNHEDEDLFLSNGIGSECKSYYLKGSGVDLNNYSNNIKSKDSKVRIIYTGRMIKEKGVKDLIDAAEILRGEYQDKIEFLLCGNLTNHPDSIKEEEIKSWCDEEYIKWLGHREDIARLLEESDIMCYPSYYREGVPKSILEACAASLPIVTTNSVGCKDTVDESVNGLLVPPHSPEELSKALKELIDNKELREEMGRNSRLKAVLEFDVEDVALQHMKIYESLS